MVGYQAYSKGNSSEPSGSPTRRRRRTTRKRTKTSNLSLRKANRKGTEDTNSKEVFKQIYCVTTTSWKEQVKLPNLATYSVQKPKMHLNVLYVHLGAFFVFSRRISPKLGSFTNARWPLTLFP